MSNERGDGVVAGAAWWVGGVDVDEKFGEQTEETLDSDAEEEQVNFQMYPRDCQMPRHI